MANKSPLLQVVVWPSQTWNVMILHRKLSDPGRASEIFVTYILSECSNVLRKWEVGFCCIKLTHMMSQGFPFKVALLDCYAILIVLSVPLFFTHVHHGHLNNVGPPTKWCFGIRRTFLRNGFFKVPQNKTCCRVGSRWNFLPLSIGSGFHRCFIIKRKQKSSRKWEKLLDVSLTPFKGMPTPVRGTRQPWEGFYLGNSDLIHIYIYLCIL